MNFSYVGKLEHFEDVLRRLEQHLGLSKSLCAEGRNRSLSFGGNPYTKELADKVYALYQSDFEVLRYGRNTWATDLQQSQKDSATSGVSIDQFLDEIVERNVIISSLHQETGRLNAQLRWVSRLHLAPAFDGLFALRSISKRAARKIERWARRVPRRRRRIFSRAIADRRTPPAPLSTSAVAPGDCVNKFNVRVEE
jgi:hypothetical protein